MKTKKQSFFFTYVLIGSIAIYWHASPYNPQLEYNKLEQLIGQELQTKNEENKKEIQKQKEKEDIIYNEILKKYKDINPYHYILHLFTFKIAFPIFLIITIGSDEPQDQYTQEFINLMQEKMKRYSRRLSNSISQECKKYLELIEKHKPS